MIRSDIQMSVREQKEKQKNTSTVVYMMKEMNKILLVQQAGIDGHMHRQCKVHCKMWQFGPIYS